MEIMGYPFTNVIISSLLDAALHQENQDVVYENYYGGNSRKLPHNEYNNNNNNNNGNNNNNDDAFYDKNSTFYDEDGSVSAFGMGMCLFAFATVNILVILRTTGIDRSRRYGGGTVDHTSLVERSFQGVLALIGIVVPIVFVITFPMSTQEVLIIICCGVVLPYVIAVVVYLLCYYAKDDDDDKEEEEEPTNNNNPAEEEP